MGTSHPDDRPTPQRRKPPYARAIGWTVVAWGWTVAATYLISQGLPQVGGWVALAGLVFGLWFGGSYGGLAGRREWVLFVVGMVLVSWLLVGLGSCAYAMALYG